MSSFPCTYCDSAFDNDDSFRRHLEDTHPVEIASESFNDGSADYDQKSDESDDEMMRNLLCGNMVQVNMAKDEEPEPVASQQRSSVPTPEQGLEMLRNIPSLSIRPVIRNFVQNRDAARNVQQATLSIRPVLKSPLKNTMSKSRLTPQALPKHLQAIVPPPGKHSRVSTPRGSPKTKTPPAGPPPAQPSEEFVRAMICILAPRSERAESSLRICIMCSKSFNDDKSLLGHHIKHLSDSLLCFACHRTFVTNEDYTNHLVVHELDESNGVNLPKPCFICSASFGKHDELITHVKGHRPMFVCDHCHQKYARKRDLDIHVYKTWNMKCPMCPEEFPCQGLFKAHVRSHSARHECVLCDKTFATKEALENHDTMFHNNPKSFQCPMCDANYTQIALLQAHLATFPHEKGNSEKVFLCEVCQKGFSTVKYLKTHLKTHAINCANECELCEEVFLNQSQLDEHVLKDHGVSAALTCTICTLVLENRKVLQKHMRQHTGEDLFVCTICGKTFGQKRSLISHRKLHTDGLPYECEICGMAFRVPSTMYRHHQAHHPDAPSTSSPMEEEGDERDEMLQVEVEITEGRGLVPQRGEPDTLVVFKKDTDRHF